MQGVSWKVKGNDEMKWKRNNSVCKTGKKETVTEVKEK